MGTTDSLEDAADRIADILRADLQAMLRRAALRLRKTAITANLQYRATAAGEVVAGQLAACHFAKPFPIPLAGPSPAISA